MSGRALAHSGSPNHDERGGAAISMIVLHYTGMADGASALARLRDPAPTAGRYRAATPVALPPDDAAELPRVSAHFCVEEDGTVHALVAEERRAWHAGVAAWRGVSDVNAASVGIEIVNGGHDYGLPPYPEAQIAAVRELVADVRTRHGIGWDAVVGHEEIALERKRDPGPRFPWSRFDPSPLPDPPLAPSRRLCGPGDAGATVARLQGRLAAWGYALVESRAYDARTAAAAAVFRARHHPNGDAAGPWTFGDDAVLTARLAAVGFDA